MHDRVSPQDLAARVVRTGQPNPPHLARASKAQIPFKWMSYDDLWKQWSAVPELEKHVQNLKARYQLTLQP